MVIDLQVFYQKFNSDYFGGKLPQVRVLQRKLGLCKGANRYGYTQFIGNEPVAIFLNSDLRKQGWIDTTLMTLLHEMAHVKLPVRVGHGPRFQKEMQRLARIGAFEGLW